MEIVITKVKLTQNIFKQFPALPTELLFADDIECLGYFLNIKHPNYKAESKLFLFKHEDKYFVLRDYLNWKARSNGEVSYKNYFVRFSSEKDASEFLNRFNELVKDKTQLFI